MQISIKNFCMTSYMHVVKCDTYTNAHCLYIGKTCLNEAMCMYMRIHEYAHILHTHIHTHMDTGAQAHTQLYIHQNIFMLTHTIMCQHTRIYPHKCIHAQILMHTHILIKIH